MGFPIKVLRNNGPHKVFNSLEELRQWLEEEQQAWEWLGQPVIQTMAYGVQIIQIQLAPLYTLKNMLPLENAVLGEEEERALRAELNVAMFDHDRYLFSDVNAHQIVRIAIDEQQPEKALGMLVQALHWPARPDEPAIISAGRQAWQKISVESQKKEPPTLIVNSTNSDVNISFGDQDAWQDQRKKLHEFNLWQESKNSSTHLLQALKNEAERTADTSWKIATMIVAWSILCVAGWLFVHQYYGPVSNGKEINWASWLERAPLYLLLFTAFFWGLRWLTRWFGESWAAQQSCHRRITSLELVIADRGAQLLLNYDEKDRECIRQQVFWQTTLSESGAAKSEESLPLEALDKLLEIVKKMREAGLDEKGKPGK